MTSLPLRVVMDTSVLISAFRSRQGASHAFLSAALAEEFALVASTPLLLEYEAVLLRSEHRAAAAAASAAFLEMLIPHLQFVNIYYRYRPQLIDAGDEHVLEAAINANARWIVTFNARHFLPAASNFGIQVVTPGAMINNRR